MRMRWAKRRFRLFLCIYNHAQNTGIHGGWPTSFPDATISSGERYGSGSIRKFRASLRAHISISARYLSERLAQISYAAAAIIVEVA